MCLRTQHEQKLIHTMLRGASKRKLYMPLAKPIECDTDNGWPENNEVGVYRAPLCESAEGLLRSGEDRGDAAQSRGQRHQSTARCVRYCDNDS